MRHLFLFFIFNLFLLRPLYSQIEPVKLSGFAQGTTYHITYFDSSNRHLQPEIDSILLDFDKSLSIYNPVSIISRINSNEKNVIVDRYFIACFNKAKEIWKATGGAFDPTVLPLVNAWGFGPGKKQEIDQSRIDSMLEFVGFELIELDLKTKSVIKKDKRVSLDFNAFAQGYSVDIISEFLESRGIHSFLGEIGGELYAKGKKSNGEKWRVGIEKPFDNPDSLNPSQIIVSLQNRALATSGNYRKFFMENGVRYAHHLDPHTGYPAKNNLLSASVFANDCISSDAYATAMLVMGLDKAIKYLKKHKELQAYLIYSDENGNYCIYQTPLFSTFISER